MHKTDDLEDGYLGSGTYFSRALEKYSKENFEREIFNKKVKKDDKMCKFLKQFLSKIKNLLIFCNI